MLFFYHAYTCSLSAGWR